MQVWGKRIIVMKKKSFVDSKYSLEITMKFLFF